MPEWHFGVSAWQPVSVQDGYPESDGCSHADHRGPVEGGRILSWNACAKQAFCLKKSGKKRWKSLKVSAFVQKVGQPYVRAVGGWWGVVVAIHMHAPSSAHLPPPNRRSRFPTGLGARMAHAENAEPYPCTPGTL